MRLSDFDYDCLQKKRLAQQAKHRKRGSKSKKCSLPSDHMTQKQWKERCGKMVAISMNSPAPWKLFKEMSVTTQEEYIKNLMNTYNVNATSLSEMFGVSPVTVRKHIEKSGMDVRFKVGASMNNDQRSRWEQFVVGDVPLEVVCESELQDNATEIEHGEDATPCDSENYGSSGVCTTTDERASRGMDMTHFSLNFSGGLDVSAIANSLLKILGDNSYGEIEITCDLSRP